MGWRSPVEVKVDRNAVEAWKQLAPRRRYPLVLGRLGKMLDEVSADIRDLINEFSGTPEA